MFGLDGKKVVKNIKMRVTKISLVKHPATMLPAVMLKSADICPALAPVAAKPPETMAEWAARIVGLIAKK